MGLALACGPRPRAPDASPPFARLATYRAPGGRFAATVGPGPHAGSERFYASFMYDQDTFEIVAIDPETGAFEVFANPVPGEYGARSMVRGPDGHVYVGTLPGGRLLRLDPRARTLVDLGQPSPGETFIWDLTFAADGKLYGGTSPGARLVRYDPATRALEDLGRMDPVQQYARYVAASADGFVYAGIGAASMNLVAYDTATGEVRAILPDAYKQIGFVNVYRGADGAVYAVAGAQRFRLAGFTATPIDAAAAAPRVYPDRLGDGRALALEPHALVVLDPRTGVTVRRPFAYAGRELPLYRLGLGPDGRLYGSSILPARLVRLDVAGDALEAIAELGDGEVYQFLSHRDRLLMGCYACGAPLLSFDPSASPSTGSVANPSPVSVPGSDPGWRPMASVEGPDGKAYLGAVPGYGQLGGPLVRWDGSTSTAVEVFPSVVPEQSVTALAAWGSRIVGGTSVRGGGGAVPTQPSAKLFVWDPATRGTQLELVPVPGAQSIDNLVVAPGDLALGVADHTLFVVDLSRGVVVRTAELPFAGGVVYGGMGLGPDGQIWGLAAGEGAGIFTVEPRSGQVRVVARPPEPITAGFVLRDGALYFASGARLYRFTLAAADALPPAP